MKDFDSLIPRFETALEILATGKGDVRSRMKDVVCVLICILPNEIPLKFRKEWEKMWYVLSKYEPILENQGGSIASLEKIKNSTGQKMAKLIYEILKEIKK
ncbi:MAG: hypothetical protein WCW56_01440 [Candidatus Paceibacterota bacterium]|jgi:hypothetical protein